MKLGQEIFLTKRFSSFCLYFIVLLTVYNFSHVNAQSCNIELKTENE